MHLDHFGSVTSIEEITCMGGGLNYQFSTSCQQQPKEKLFVVDQTAVYCIVTLKNSECDIYIDKML